MQMLPGDRFDNPIRATAAPAPYLPVSNTNFLLFILVVNLSPSLLKIGFLFYREYHTRMRRYHSKVRIPHRITKRQEVFTTCLILVTFEYLLVLSEYLDSRTGGRILFDIMNSIRS